MLHLSISSSAEIVTDFLSSSTVHLLLTYVIVPLRTDSKERRRAADPSRDTSLQAELRIGGLGGKLAA